MNNIPSAGLAIRCVVIIIDTNSRTALTDFLDEAGISMYYQTHGIGTASSDFLNLCGLGDTRKTVVMCFVPKQRAHMLLAELNQALGLHRRGTGIAVSIPLGGLQGWMYKLFEGKEVRDMEQSTTQNKQQKITHAMLLISVNQGYGEEVMRTARAAGATGGTILKGLRCLPDEAARHFGIPVQEEMEIISIVTPAGIRTEIMSAISAQHGINSPAHGIVTALPVDAISGL